MKTTTCVQVAAVLAAWFAIAAPASANWKKVTDRYTPSAPGDQTDQCVNIFGTVIGDAKATVSSTAELAKGTGYAWDTSIGCDVRVNNSAVGVKIIAWQFHSDKDCKQGKVKCTTSTSAKGSVDLANADCAAAAIGYAQVSSSVTALITAELLKSAGETTSDGLGDLSLEIEGIGASVPITVSTGEGVYPDEDQDADTGHECTNFFKVKWKSRADIQMYANAGLDPLAECDGWMWAKGSAIYDLGCC